MAESIHSRYYVGLDVGSTTVKAIVTLENSRKVLWKDYKRHFTKQPETVLEFLKRIKEAFPVPDDHFRFFITGSGGAACGKTIGAKFVQEVNAVSLAVETRCPDVRSVVELGGQDAKMIFFQVDPKTKKKKKTATMNDKCAGGTGAVIDKISAKLKIDPEEVCEKRYVGINLHPVAGKCGVFAETDVNSLQKKGVDVDEIMASLFESIVQQNISVLTRGNTLRPKVLLLGGPNTFVRGMREAWHVAIQQMWKERKVEIPRGVPIEELVFVPEEGLYFAAIGAVEFGRREEDNIGTFKGVKALDHYLKVGREKEKEEKGSSFGLYKTPEELEQFKENYRRIPFERARFKKGEVVRGFIGVDGGSTSTKGVVLGPDKKILCKAYQLSRGNPIQDVMEVVGSLRRQIEEEGAKLEVLGVASTGYAKDILNDVLHGDVALVETVAHTKSAEHFYPDVDVICDIGGQDIKIIILKGGRVKDFKLNTQCSAGNGYFLQNTAEGFGFSVTEFADKAFSAKRMPVFGYGCAVFMQSDIVDFQRQGWKPEEIMAGLANVLPKNVWLYVCGIPDLASLGKTFVLQGGTQYNLAAVKAQVDFIHSRYRGNGHSPTVHVHQHAGECGAIGAAIEAIRLYEEGHVTRFIGLDAVANIEYQTTSDERTRCYFCKNKCLRTFVDVKTSSDSKSDQTKLYAKSKVPLNEGMSRIIVATCEKGTVEDLNAMRAIKSGLDAKLKENPNYAAVLSREVWKPVHARNVSDTPPSKVWRKKHEVRAKQLEKRKKTHIGIPRVLNMYSTTPFFNAYFESLGVPSENIIFSDYTNEKLYKQGAKRGAIDPCFPSKLGIPHIHNLLYVQHKRKKLDVIFFPMINSLSTFLDNSLRSCACPTVMLTPESVRAAFVKERDLFAEEGVRYLAPLVDFANRTQLTKQLYFAMKDILWVSMEENHQAITEGFKALDEFYAEKIRKPARQVLQKLEREGQVGIVILGRVYHADPGINHAIFEEFQKLGYPVFTAESLPIDDEYLKPLFQEDLKEGYISSPREINDVWKNAYSENTNRKIWAAKFTARHPNLVALEISSFKCGHDATTYSVIQGIIETSGTPYFSFKDIDENKPTGSIKIRVETIDYFLKRFGEQLKRQKQNAHMRHEYTLKAKSEEPMVQACNF